MDLSFNMPRSLENTIRIEEVGRTSIYLAEVFELEVRSLTVYGKSRLTKKTEATVPQRVLASQEEMSLTNRPPTGLLARLFSSVKSSRGNGEASPAPALATKPEWLIVGDRGALADENGRCTKLNNYSYRTHLVSAAANNGLIITGSLLDAAFGPIESDLAALIQGLIKAAGQR
ncbi:MAG TPA: hypothetical protein VLE93_03675 [Candidatus Saccharimonadales bacterium]|nr:hypothetical protein [Candidatus Saccharimonadales bacterium]